ncbi:macrophage erythroblast attacher isoform 1 [Cryptococcus neoformans]|nr:macrophage erythroblast attacher isoform 1 [Cryptococcus neoformans var. grubii]
MAPAYPANPLLLEEPLVRTSYELLRRSHRSAQRQVEKDFTVINSGLQAILKSMDKEPNADEGRVEIVKKIDQIAERANGLKRKLDDLQPSASRPTTLRARLDYLGQNFPGSTTPFKKTKPKGESNGTAASKADKTDAVSNDMQVDEEDAISLPSNEADKSEPTPDSSTLDRYIVDYLIRKGRLNSATALATSQGIEALVDIKLFAELAKIENALVEKHSCTEGLAWCGENRGTLKKTKNNLEFTLRLQEFIELCRKRDITTAIAYARKYLSGWASAHMSEFQKGMSLLAFGEKTGVTPYRKLYDQSRWEAVRDQFRETFLDLYAQPSQSLLALALSAGLASLRLPSCVQHVRPNKSTGGDSISVNPVVPLLPAVPPLHNLETTLFSPASSTHLTAPVGGVPSSPTTDLHAHPEAVTGNIDCPTCDENMRVLASEVPMSHHVNSTIVCRISGRVMDSENEPLAFPNGYVYSSKALAEMAKNNFDVVTCPRTRESCAFGRLRKVYIS